MNSVDGQVDRVFYDVFNNEQLQLRDNMTFKDVAGWDSAAHVLLITALEQEFNIKFSIRDVMAMNTVGAIRKIVAEKRAASTTP